MIIFFPIVLFAMTCYYSAMLFGTSVLEIVPGNKLCKTQFVT